MNRVIVNPGYWCNNHCRICLHGDRREELRPLDLTETEALLKEAREKSDRLILTGGELTIRPDFTEIIQAAWRAEFKEVMVETNGRMFAYKPFALKASKLNITAFIVAVQGHDAEAHDYVTKVADSYKQTLTGIRHMKMLRQQVYTQTVITRSNYRHLPALVSLFDRYKIDRIQFTFPRLTGSAAADAVRIAPRYALLETYLKDSYKAARRASIAFRVEGVPPCFLIGMQKLMVEELEPTRWYMDGKETLESSPEVRRAEQKSYGPVCDVCDAKDRCEGAWKDYVDLYGWNEFEPVGGASVEHLRTLPAPPTSTGEFVHDKPVEK